MHERLTKSTASFTPPARCACGGTVGATGECAACREKRLAATRATPAAQAAPGRGPAGFRFAEVPMYPAVKEPAPRIHVREFATAGDSPVAGRAPDKSTREESELQDQSASVSTYVATASGVRMVVDAVGVAPSPRYP